MSACNPVTLPALAFSFHLPGEPVGKERARTFLNPRSGRITTWTPARTAEYAERIRLVAQLAISKARYCIPKEHHQYRVHLTWGRSRKLGADGDNIMKAVKDALNTLAYPDDRYVFDGTYHFDPELPPGIWVTVTATQPLPARFVPAPKKPAPKKRKEKPRG